MSDKEISEYIQITNMYLKKKKEIEELENEEKSIDEAIEEIELTVDDDMIIPLAYGQQYVYLKAEKAIEELTKRALRKKAEISEKRSEMMEFKLKNKI